MKSASVLPTYQPSANDIQIAEIQKIIEGKFEYFQAHLKYIINLQLGRINQEEARDYFTQLFPENTKLPAQPKQLLTELKETITDKIHLFSRLAKTFRPPVTDAQLAALRQILLQTLEQEKLTKKKVGGSNQFGLLPDFNLKSMLLSLLQKTESILPSWINQLDRYTKLEFLWMQTIEKEQETKRITADSPIFALTINGNILCDEIKKTQHEMIHAKRTILVPKMIQQEVNDFINKRISRLCTIYENVEAVIKSLELVDQEDKLAIPLEHFMTSAIEYVYISRYFNDYMQEINDLKQHLDQYKKTVARYLQERTTALQAIKAMGSQWSTMRGRLHETATHAIMANEQVALTALEQQLDPLKNKINALHEQWPDKMPAYIREEAHFLEKDELFKRSLNELKAALNQVNEQLMQSVQRAHDSKIQAALAKEAEEKQREEESARLKAVFVAEQREKYDAYRKTVQEERDKKEKLSTFASSLFAPAAPVTLYKDSTVEELLHNLSDYYLTILSTILNLGRGCTYSDLFSLVRNHLQGEVLEIGNGSSHLRIVLRKFTIEVPVNAEDTAQLLEASSSATGGMYRAHHGTHPSREIINFNLRLIRSVFERAGITAQVVADLQRNKTDQALRQPAAP